MMTPLQLQQSLQAVRQANELICRQLKNLAHNPHNSNAAMQLQDAQRSHSKAISTIWQPDHGVNISAARKPAQTETEHGQA